MVSSIASAWRRTGSLHSRRNCSAEAVVPVSPNGCAALVDRLPRLVGEFREHLVELLVVQLEQQVVHLRRLGASRLDARVLGDERREGLSGLERLDELHRSRLGLERIALLERGERDVLRTLLRSRSRSSTSSLLSDRAAPSIVERRHVSKGIDLGMRNSSTGACDAPARGPSGLAGAVPGRVP